MKHLLQLTIILILIGYNSCSEQVPNPVENDNNDKMQGLSYLALGDSYTIGESVSPFDRFPAQLVAASIDSGVDVNEASIIATTGWTTDELLSGIDNAGIEGQVFDIVTLLIGVNNQYRGYAVSQYEEEFKTLLAAAISFAGNDEGKVMVVSIPDYGVTPYGRRGDPDKIAKELDNYNQIAKSISMEHKVDFFNITEISREAIEDENLTASDLLHPSGKMYKRWVEEVLYTPFSQKIIQ
ncbi:MAG: lysophospholipase L1-like esterase [Cyclobacteriaceae bacterium]|jgi:lysophospholipase L1-like esterase